MATGTIGSSRRFDAIAWPSEAALDDSPSMISTGRVLRRQDFTVGWICALSHELAASRAMLDREYSQNAIEAGDPTDNNVYHWGQIEGHNVVMACLPAGKYGIGAAAIVANNMLRSYHSLQVNLLVGIGGGVPQEDKSMKLGDVVISMPTGTFGGVVQYDFGKILPNGHFQRRGSLDKPPPILLKAVQSLRSSHDLRGSQLVANLDRMRRTYPLMRELYDYPKTANIALPKELEPNRSSERPHEPRIHYGLIASGNRVIASAEERERLCRDGQILCIEMEAAGLMDDFKCLVIRGVSDLADSAKGDVWQNYAAATAAAYARELLQAIPPSGTKVNMAVVADSKDTYRTDLYVAGLQLGHAYRLEESLFVGREADLEAMGEQLFKKLDSPRTIVLAGLGGIGKTQLALRFAALHKNKFSSVWCLDASSVTSISNSLIAVAHMYSQLQYGQTQGSGALQDETALVESALRWLSEPANDRWLLLYDNYDDPDLAGIRSTTGYDIRKYFPFVLHGSVIITTRSPKVQIGRMIHIKILPELKLGLDVLAKRSQRSGITTDPGAIRLAKRLNGFPLALAAAGDYLRDCPDSFDQYLEGYEKAWVDLSEATNLPDYEDRTLHSTWNVSFQRVESIAPEAAQFLRFLAYFDYKDIWYELFSLKEGTDTSLEKKGLRENLPKWFREVTSSRIKFNANMRKLQDFSFVDLSDDTQSYSLHVCVHDWTLEILNPKPDEQLFNMAVLCLGSIVPSRESPLYWSAIQRLDGHGSRLLHDRMKSLGTSNDKHTSAAYLTLGSMYIDQQKLVAASIFCNKALRGREKEDGHVMGVLTLLDVTYDLLKNSEEAEGAFFQALRSSVADESEDLMFLNCYSHLAGLYLEQGKLDEAENVFLQVLRRHNMMHKTLIELDLESRSNHSLGIIYTKQRRWKDAEQSFRKAHDGYKKLKRYGSFRHRWTFITSVALANVLAKTGQLKEAESLMLGARKWMKEFHGPQTKDILISICSLGLLYSHQQRLDEAKQVFDAALKGFMEILGPLYRDTSIARCNLAIVLDKQDQDGDANSIWSTMMPLQKEQVVLYYEEEGLAEEAEAVRRVLARDEPYMFEPVESHNN